MTRILSNFKSLDQVILPEQEIVHDYLDDRSSALQFLRQCLRADVVILNIDQWRLILAALLRWLPFVRFRLVSVDLILRRPKSAKGRLKASIKKLLLAGVDRFVLYFKNLESYQRFYGIGPDRVVYIPFKVNGWESIVARPRQKAAGDFVLCAGRTLRDTVTFVEAMRHVECPGVLLQQKRELLDAHGTSAWSGELPSNVKLIVDESDRFEDYLEFVAQARLVVIPRFKHDIAPTGISTYLVAMALNKCVIISKGPGAEDVLTDQAVIVPPEDVDSLAEQIERLWHDDNLRTEIAGRGYDYAMSLGGYDRLLKDILRVSFQTVIKSSRSRRADCARDIETSR